MHRLEAGIVKCLDHLFAPNHNDTVTVANFYNNRTRILTNSVFDIFVKVKQSWTVCTENDSALIEKFSHI